MHIFLPELISFRCSLAGVWNAKKQEKNLIKLESNFGAKSCAEIIIKTIIKTAPHPANDEVFCYNYARNFTNPTQLNFLLQVVRVGVKSDGTVRAHNEAKCELSRLSHNKQQFN